MALDYLKVYTRKYFATTGLKMEYLLKDNMEFHWFTKKLKWKFDLEQM